MKSNDLTPDSLIELSHGGQAGKPDLILRAAAELFTERVHHSHEDCLLFAELARQYLPQASTENRRLIARRLASFQHTPLETLRALARDEAPEVAQEILTQRLDLPESDIVAIVGAGPESLRRVLAQTPSISTQVAIELCRHADHETLTSLIERLGASMSEPMLRILRQRPEVMSRLCSLLAHHDLLPSKLLLFYFLDLDRPGRLKAISGAQTRVLTEIAQSLEPGVAPRIRPASPRAHVKPDILQRLAGAALNGGAAAFAAHLSYTLNLSAETAARIVNDMSGEATAICLKAAGMNADFAARILVRLYGLSLSLEPIRNLIALFNQIPLQAAGKFVETWRGGDDEKTYSHQTAAKHQSIYAGEKHELSNKRGKTKSYATTTSQRLSRIRRDAS